jgi:hypothetical protein
MPLYSRLPVLHAYTRLDSPILILVRYLTLDCIHKKIQESNFLRYTRSSVEFSSTYIPDVFNCYLATQKTDLYSHTHTYTHRLIHTYNYATPGFRFISFAPSWKLAAPLESSHQSHTQYIRKCPNQQF